MICNKSGFPVKFVNDNWYHPTCMILTNFVIIKDSVF
jgi:hypothetical protein